MTRATPSPGGRLRSAYPRSVDLGGQSITLRRLQNADTDKLVGFARGLPEENLLFLRVDLTRAEVVDELIRSQGGDHRFTLLAEIDNELVGYASLNRDDLSWARHMGEIRLLTGAAERGKGLGSLLARELFAIAGELGLTKLVARMVREQSGARRLFERLGFTAEALLTDWVVDRGGATHDLVVMSYDVTALTN